ncbi:MAG: type IV pilus modification protein PilV [Kangiellaceae bacterium]|nr:type IV pilus modification protein PilV [Kangiellaceae bacterium]
MRIQKNKGFSLMEVLIAVVIIAIGILGFLGLQALGTVSSQSGELRGQANAVAENLISSMRANRDYINCDESDPDNNANCSTANSSNIYSTNSDYICRATDGSALNTPAKLCTTNSCTPSELAEFDAWSVCMQMMPTTTAQDNMLPDGEIFVACTDKDSTDTDTCSVGSKHSVYVFWAGRMERTGSGQNTTNIASQCTTYWTATLGRDASELERRDCTFMEFIP